MFKDEIQLIFGLLMPGQVVPFFFGTSVEFGPTHSDGSRHTQLVVIVYGHDRFLYLNRVLVSLETRYGFSFSSAFRNF